MKMTAGVVIDPETMMYSIDSVEFLRNQLRQNVFSLQNDQTDEPMENPQEVIEECLSKFCTPDYIMEPGIFTQLKR